jgi:hypothetical protein
MAEGDLRHAGTIVELMLREGGERQVTIELAPAAD